MKSDTDSVPNLIPADVDIIVQSSTAESVTFICKDNDAAGCWYSWWKPDALLWTYYRFVYRYGRWKDGKSFQR